MMQSIRWQYRPVPTIITTRSILIPNQRLILIPNKRTESIGWCKRPIPRNHSRPILILRVDPHIDMLPDNVTIASESKARWLNRGCLQRTWRPPFGFGGWCQSKMWLVPPLRIRRHPCQTSIRISNVSWVLSTSSRLSPSSSYHFLGAMIDWIRSNVTAIIALMFPQRAAQLEY